MRLLSLALVIGLFGFACELHAQFVTVNVQINPPGAGTVVDNFGITYPGPAISYTNGTTITFTANPQGAGVTFTNWTGTPPASAANPRALNLSPWNNGNITLIANFFVPPTAPSVSGPTSSAITGTTATLGGNVTSDGNATITARGVVYSVTSTNGNPVIGGTGVTNATASGTTGSFTVNASSLSPSTQYSFKAYATNSVGTTYTSTGTFTTDSPPTVTTPTSASVGSVTATLGGNVTGDGGASITSRGVVYSVTSTNSNPSIGGSGVSNQTTSGTTGVFTVNVSGLAPSTGYSFKAYAINAQGTSYTTTGTFTTLALPNILSINRVGAAANPTNAASVTWDVTFSASVSGLQISNFSLNSPGLTSAAVTGVSGSGTSWTVTASTGTGSGTIRADLTNAGSVSPGIGNVAFTAGQSYTIDKTAPTVTGIVRANANPTNSTTVNFTVNFSEPVTGVAAGNFAIDSTGSVAGATIGAVTGSGGTRNVSVNTGSGDGTLSVDLLTVTGIQDAVGNALGTAFTSGEAYTIDKTGPGISIGAPSVSGTISGPVDYIVSYTGASSISLVSGDVSLNTTGTAAATTVTISGTGTSQRTVTISGITGTGTIGINIASSTAADALNNQAGAAGPSATFTATALASISSIVRIGGSSSNAAQVSWTITLTASVTSFTTANLGITVGGLSGASVASLTGSGTSWTATANTGTGNGTIRMDVTNDNTVSPGIANVPFTTGDTITIDKTAPTVTSIVRASGGTPTNLGSVDFDVTFSETVSGVTTGAFSLDTTGVSSPSITGISGSGASYTVTVSTGSGDGNVSIDLSNVGGIADPAGNGLATTFTTGEVYAVDKTAPTVVSITRTTGFGNPTNVGSVNFTVTFSEVVSGVVMGLFAVDATGVTGASVTGLSGTGTTRTVSVSTGSNDGSLSIDLTTFSVIQDDAGNAMGAAFTAGEAFTIDKTAPTVVSIVRTSSTNPTNASSVDFTVTFTEAVTGVASGAFALDFSGVTGPTLGTITGSGTTRTVSVNTGSGDGDVSIDLSTVTGIVDAAGNVLGGTFTAGQSYTIDKTAPTVVSINRTGATNPTNASSVDFTVTFSEVVTGVITGAFSLDTTGVASAFISSLSGSGTTRTVSVNTGTGDGTVSIDLSTVTGIIDGAGNTLGAVFTAGQSYDIDKSGPGVSIGAPSTSQTTSGPVTFTVTYTGATAVTLAVGDVTLNTTGTATGTVGVSGTGTATRTVTISSISGDGTLGISIAGATATDALSNAAAAAGPSTTFDVVSLPTVAIGAPSLTATAGATVDFTLTYTNATAVNLVVGDVTLTTTGTAAGTVGVSGTGTATRTVSVSGIAGDGSFTISIAAGTSSNTAGNDIGAGPSASVTVDNTAPGMVAGSTVSLLQGSTSTGASIGTVTDTSTALGSLVVTATTVPTGLSVANINNTGGTITGDITTTPTATVGMQQIEFTVTDDAGNSSTALLTIDVLFNNAPTITVIGDQSIAMNANTGALAFTVDDIEDAATALAVTATSNNQVLVVPGTDITLGGSGATRTILVTPQTNGVGAALITVTVTDTNGASTDTTFTVTANDTTDAPILSLIPDILMAPDTTTGDIGFTADDPQGAGTLNAPVATSNNTALIANADIVITGTAPNFSFTVTPQATIKGTAVITLSVSDGTFTASRSFNVFVQDPTPPEDDDDEECSTGESSGFSLLMLLGLLSAIAVGVRSTRRSA